MSQIIVDLEKEVDVVQRANDAVADILDGESLAVGMVFICCVFEGISEGQDRAWILAGIVNALVNTLGFNFTYPPKGDGEHE